MDIGVINNALARFLPGGFYYKTFIHPRAAWKHIFEPIIRKAAGLGPAPKEMDGDRYEQAYAFCDVLIAGGGIAGLQAALAAASGGARVMVLEQTPVWPRTVWPITPPEMAARKSGCGEFAQGGSWRRQGLESGLCLLRAMMCRVLCLPRRCAIMW